MGDHLRLGRCTDTPWWQGLVSTSCPEFCAHRGTSLSRSTSHLPAMPHWHVSCHLCFAFPLHQQSSSISIRSVQASSPSFLSQDLLLRAGVPLFQLELLPTKLEEIVPMALPTPLHWRGKESKEREAEINSSLTSVHLLRVFPACQMRAPWKQQQAN